MSANRSLLEAHQAYGILFVRDPDGGMALNTHIPDPATAGIYRDLTLGGAQAGLSYYFLDNWLRFIHPVRVSIYARLRATARVKGTPSPSMADLAGSISLKPDVVRRHFTQWWFIPQPENPEWRFFQAAVEIVRREGNTYQFRSVVLGDILSDADLAKLAGKLQITGPEGQQEMLLGDPHEIHGGGTPDPHEIHGGGTPDPHEIHGGGTETAWSLPPHTPPTPARVPMPMPGKASTRRPESDNCEGSDYPALNAVACQLAERGVSDAALRILEHYPEWGHWAQRWLVWSRHKKGLLNPGAFLFSRIRGACEGNEADRRPPFEFQEAQSRRRKSIARTESILAERPKPVYRQDEERAAPAPLQVAPELLPAWQHFEAACKLAKAPLWAVAAAIPLEISAGTFRIRLAGAAQVDALRTKRCRILDAAAELGADFTDLHFVTEREAPRG